MGVSKSHQLARKGKSLAILYVGIDLAKNVLRCRESMSTARRCWCVRVSGKRGKNDAADAQAICEAVQRPNMRLVPVKSQDEQARLCVHRVRQGFVEQRTATIIGCAAC
jgi:transposase